MLIKWAADCILFTQKSVYKFWTKGLVCYFLMQTLKILALIMRPSSRIATLKFEIYCIFSLGLFIRFELFELGLCLFSLITNL